MVFGKKGGMGLFGGNANGLIATDNTPPPLQPPPQQKQQQQQSNTNASTGAVTVEAIYAFDAEQQDELSFGKGALVMDVTVKDDDWYGVVFLWCCAFVVLFFLMLCFLLLGETTQVLRLSSR
jgi:hypothetical protein